MTNNLSLQTKGADRNSFTLIELLVVLALVAILSVVVVMTLNPAELLKQARDSNRLSDLATINTALNLFSADVTSGFMGTSTIVYTSLVNTVNPATTTCAGMGLPTLPTGWTYNCPTSTQSLRNTDGTGWIPVNFQRISSNSPISQLPVDPQNTTSTKYYTYVTGGSWKVTATPESVKYTATAGTDGGTNIGQFEVGNNMSLAPFTDGLVGWWKFDGDATDSSGFGNNGTWYGTSTSRYVTGKVGQYAGYFNGSSDYVDTIARDYFSPNSNAVTMSAWVNINVNYLINNGAVFGHGAWDYTLYAAYGVPAAFALYTVGGSDAGTVYGVATIPINTWVHLAGVSDYGNRRAYLYVNGVMDNSTNINGVLSYISHSLTIGTDPHGVPLSGNIDDARFYNRALSAAEVSALYNATK